jgi:hypothetical protein
MLQPTKKEVEFAKKLYKYKNQWVALKKKEVVASGKTLDAVYKQVERKQIKGHVFHLVPAHPLAVYEI